MLKNPTPTGVTLFLEIIGLLDNNFAILFERVGIKPQKRFQDGQYRYGYGMGKEGKEFYFTLPEDYFREYKRYTFNFWRNIVLVALILGALKLAG